LVKVVNRRPPIGYLSVTQGDFIADEFTKAYPAIHEATRTISSGSSPARVTATSVTRSSSIKTYRNGYSKDFVKYIQYTLLDQQYKLTINGEYDKATANAIMSFQKSKNLSFIDALVDSETKSVLATYWLSLLKNNTDLYNEKIKEAPEGVQKYIKAAVKYSDIANVGVPGREYRRISFTGVPGPTEIVDNFIVKIPQVASGQKIHGITISTGSWPAVFESVFLYKQDFNVNAFYTQLGANAKIPNAQYETGIMGDTEIAPNSSHTINFDTYQGVENIKYAMITIKGRKLLAQKYGPNAEGFSVSDIQFAISSDGTYTPPELGGSSRFQGVATGKISGYTEIESSEQKAIDFASVNTLLAGTSSIESIQITNISFEASSNGVKKQINHTIPSSEIERKNKLNLNYSFAESYSGDGNIAITLDPLSQNLGLNLNNVGTIPISRAQIISANTFSDASISDFSITKVDGRPNLYVVKTTNGIQYNSTEAFPQVNVENYYIADADNIASRQNIKLTINAKDGLVVLVNSNGTPAGFPNFASYQNTSSNTIFGFGFINLLWGGANPAPYGLDWQFLYINPSSGQRTFLGRKITYAEFVQKGPANIYIGLNVYDADMNQQTINNIVGESLRNSQLVQLNKPTRYICPVYSVKVISRPKIAVSAPPSTLTKFDTWYVNLTPGKFVKQITIPAAYNFTNWLKEYRGQNLKCYYDTTKIKTPYSSIFGFGYYDVYDENPKIVSDNEIALRHGQIHCVQEQYDKTYQVPSSGQNQYTDASPIVPWIKVYLKKNNDTWVEVSRKEIKSFDKHTGLIKFKKEIVPLESKDIQVSYTIKTSNIMIHQIDGQLLPINPYSAPKTNRPIFLYILPLKCEQMSGTNSSVINEFVAQGAIQYTNDSNIFKISSNSYNPLALHIATILINNKYDFSNVKVEDMRLRGGGLSSKVDIGRIFEENKDIGSYADLYTGKAYLHPNGGYVVVQIPREVMNNFSSKQEVYNIVRNNITAGVSFDIQDLDGIDWRSIDND